MIQFFLFALFFVLFASRALGFDLSLVPGISVKNAFLYLIFLGLAIQTVITRQRRLEVMSVIGPFAIYVGYAIFTWVAILLIVKYPNYDIGISLIHLKSGPIEFLLVFLIYFYGISNSQDAMKLIQNMVLLIILGNVVSVVDALNIVDLGLVAERDDGRIGGTIGQSNEFAMFLALFLPAIFTIYLKSDGPTKWLIGAGVFLSCLAFLLAMSRGAIVALAVGGILSAYYLRAVIPFRLVVRATVSISLLCVLVVVGAMIVGYGDLIAERFAKFGAGGTVASSGRTVIWAKALTSMLENPITFITGYGWHSYETFRIATNSSHNTYLDILYNLGIIGEIFFLLTIANLLRIIRSSINVASPKAKAWLISFIFGFIALLVSLFFGELYNTWLYTWAFVGISLRLAVSERDSEPTGNPQFARMEPAAEPRSVASHRVSDS